MLCYALTDIQAYKHTDRHKDIQTRALLCRERVSRYVVKGYAAGRLRAADIPTLPGRRVGAPNLRARPLLTLIPVLAQYMNVRSYAMNESQETR